MFKIPGWESERYLEMYCVVINARTIESPQCAHFLQDNYIQYLKFHKQGSLFKVDKFVKFDEFNGKLPLHIK